MASKTRAHHEYLEVWQWNCRTFHKRAAALQQYINTAPVKPDVICLQEIGSKPVKLTGYYTISHPDYPKVATMVLKDIATSIDYLATSSINHQIVTILPQKHSKARTIITNVYSPPKEKRADFEALIRYVKAHSSTQDRLLLLGDFNAPHTSWGYRTDTPKGRELEQAVEAYDLQLIILPQNPTRLGNSVSADTFPDLTFTNNVDEVFWTNLEENLGSDHFILSVSVGSPKIRRACGHVVITDWVNYRKVPMPQILPENATYETLIKQHLSG